MAQVVQMVAGTSKSWFYFAAVLGAASASLPWFVHEPRRIKQSEADMVLTDTDALAARKDLADRLKQREYQMAVDADMEVGSLALRWEFGCKNSIHLDFLQ